MPEIALASAPRQSALAVFTAVFFVLPIVAAYLPHNIISGFAPYLPSNAPAHPPLAVGLVGAIHLM